MTVRVERAFEIDAMPTDIWEFIADPVARAKAISVVDRFEQRGETTIWHIRLPIPFVRSTVKVRTRDVDSQPPGYVKFQGGSSAFDVIGEHTIEAVEDGTRVTNTFYVDGHIPGVEGFFKRNFGKEIGNLERALRAHLSDQ